VIDLVSKRQKECYEYSKIFTRRYANGWMCKENKGGAQLDVCASPFR
jgi:hypothetical protein